MQSWARKLLDRFAANGGSPEALASSDLGALQRENRALRAKLDDRGARIEALARELAALKREKAGAKAATPAADPGSPDPNPGAARDADGSMARAHVRIPVVELLTDAELEELNSILPWRCFVLDSAGRRFGRPSSPTKRNAPQFIPDRRTEILDERFGLSDKTVLEIGCFEGVHTTSLAQRARLVKACDSRVSNVVKTAVRCAMFQVHPELFVWDVERTVPEAQSVSCDLIHHVGVLYHLRDPVQHLRALAPQATTGILLDTHYARPEDVDHAYTADGRPYRVKKFVEGGVADPFSGMYPIAHWLLLDDLVAILEEQGFPAVEIVEERAERNGPRVLLVARR